MDNFKRVAINKGSHITESLKLWGTRVITALLLIGSAAARAQTPQDSLAQIVPIAAADSLAAPGDSLAADSLASAAAQDAVLQAEITYSAEDSIANDLINRKVYLYGDAVVKYQDITLKAAKIVYDFSTYTVHAEGYQDSTGAWLGLPFFTQGSSEFESREMDYNFKSKKAYVKQVSTKVIEGTLTGERVKTVENNRVIYVKNAEYCPCEDPNARTRFKINKVKVIKDDKIVSGPGYLTLYNIPMPLAFPFGFFPNTEKRQAGLIVPSYGDAAERGFFLEGLGFYMPIGQNFDTRITGDIYSRGSWGLNNTTRYDKRYRYSGLVDISFFKNITGDRDLNNYFASTDFFVNWSHTQDPKARPNSRFSASVNAGTSDIFTNNVNAPQELAVANTFRSSISYTQIFPNSPFQATIAGRHEQNSQTQVYNFYLPEIGLSMARINPLENLFDSDPKQYFYEKLGITYQGSFSNQLSATAAELSFGNWSSLRKQLRNGVQHSASATLPFNVGPISVIPNFNYRERWYFSTLRYNYNPDLQLFEADTVVGFDRNSDYSTGVSATTKLYGMYSFKSGRLKAIRHTLTPSVSYNYSPRTDNRVYGFFGPEASITSFSPYQISTAPFAGSALSQSVNFTLVNNLEGKYLSRRDTTGEASKFPIIENITASTSYNFAADSFNLANVNVAARTPISKYVNFNGRATFSPYAVIADSSAVRPINVYRYQRDGRLLAFENANIAFTTAGIGSKMFRNSEPEGTTIVAEGSDSASAVIPAVVHADAGFFSDFSFDWNLNLSYTLLVRNSRVVRAGAEGFTPQDSLIYTHGAIINADFNLFKRISCRINTGYDFTTKKPSATTINLVVDLNCWELTASYIPFGPRQSYSISIYLKSNMLKDLKLETNRPLGQDAFYY